MRALCRRRHDTIFNLSVEFGVSERTIRRDIEALSLTEPVYTQTGRYGGGVYVTSNYSADKTNMTKEETALLERILQYAEVGKNYFLTESDIHTIRKILKEYKKP